MKRELAKRRLRTQAALKGGNERKIKRLRSGNEELALELKYEHGVEPDISHAELPHDTPYQETGEWTGHFPTPEEMARKTTLGYGRKSRKSR